MDKFVTSCDKKHTLFLSTPEDTQKLAKILSDLLEPGDIVGLNGDLGAGKTFFVAAASRTLGVPQDFPVRSPSFSIIHEYPGQIPIYHIDLYRIRSLNAILELGLDEYLYGNGISFIEWFQMLDRYCPNEFISLHFAIHESNSRNVVISSVGQRYNQISNNCMKIFNKE